MTTLEKPWEGSTSLVSNWLHTQDELLLEELGKSFSMEGFNEEFTSSFKHQLLSLVKELPKDQQQLFMNLSFINSEIADEIPGKKKMRSDYFWVDIALQKLMKNPNQTIVLTGFSTKEMIIKKQEWTANLLFNDPHVSFIRLPFDAQSFVDFIISTLTQKQEVDTSAKESAFLKIIDEKVNRFFHDFKYQNVAEIDGIPSYSEKLKIVFSLHSENEIVKTFEDEMISLILLQHPEYKPLWRDEILHIAADFYALAKDEVSAEGERFEGVFVDWDGTLYDHETGTFNQKVLDLIEKYKSEWKEITVWTLGEVTSKQQLLDEAKIQLIVKSKIDYKWAIVEISIDDLSAEDLHNTIQVTSEHHIQL